MVFSFTWCYRRALCFVESFEPFYFPFCLLPIFSSRFLCLPLFSLFLSSATCIVPFLSRCFFLLFCLPFYFPCHKSSKSKKIDGRWYAFPFSTKFPVSSVFPMAIIMVLLPKSYAAQCTSPVPCWNTSKEKGLKKSEYDFGFMLLPCWFFNRPTYQRP